MNIDKCDVCGSDDIFVKQYGYGLIGHDIMGDMIIKKPETIISCCKACAYILDNIMGDKIND